MRPIPISARRCWSGSAARCSRSGGMKEIYGIVESDTFQTMTIQEIGGTKKIIESGVERIKEMLPMAARGAARNHRCVRTDAGAAMRRLRRLFGHHGQSGAGLCRRYPRAQWRHAILAETPEIYGAEHLLTRRAVTARSRREADQPHPLVGGLHQRNRGEMNNNPSPGNKAGGLTTILEKSLGAVAKGGTTPLTAVYEYAETGHREGLCVHGHARLRSGFGDRAGGRRRQYPGLHHRPRLGLWLQAGAVDQARHQFRHVRAA